MPQQPQYTPIARVAFSSYLSHQIDLQTLVDRLRDIELQILSEENEDPKAAKGLWIRFFEGDTEGLTIQEIEKDLSNPEHPNYKILRHGIAIGLAADELEVHYE